VNWTRIHNPKLTTSPAGATLEGDCREPLGPEAPEGYECVAEAVGWRWRFRGAVTMRPVVAMRPGASIPIVVTSLGPVTVEDAPVRQIQERGDPD
jgi:hypothetical protein